MTYAGVKRKELVGRPHTHAVYFACHRCFWGISVMRREIWGSRRQLVLVITCKSESRLHVLKYFQVGCHPNLCLGYKPPKLK